MNNRHYYTPRGFELVYHGDRPQIATLSVENRCKWYELWLVYPDGSVEFVSFALLDECCKDETPYVDHAPNPVVVARLARLRGWHLDECSYEMIIGRWEMEHTDHSKYARELGDF